MADETQVISIYSAKGGVGKTTSCSNIAAALGKINVKVLIIDMDPIGSLSTNFMQINLNNASKLFDKDIDVKKIIIKNVANNVDLIPTSLELSYKFIDNFNINNEINIKNNLNILRQQYDLILIDVSSNWSLLNQIVLSVSDSILIPVLCNQYSIDSISKTLSIIRKIQIEKNSNLKVQGVFINMFDKRTTDAINFLTEINNIFKNDLYNSIIPQDASINKLQKDNKIVVVSASWKPSGIKFSELANEIFKKLKE